MRELGGGEVVDPAEAGNEARVARGDGPERKIRELEVDRLLGKALEPSRFQRGEIGRVVRYRGGVATDRYAHQRERIGAAVVGLGDRERNALLMLHVLRVPGKPADVHIERREIVG